MNEKVTPTDQSGASVVRRIDMGEFMKAAGRYEVECRGPDGAIKWKDDILNVVTNVGKNLTLDTILAGTSFSATTVMGLKGTGAASTADTQASHGAWLEVGLANAPTYNGNRKTPTFNAAATGTKATSAAVSFAIESAGTVAGCFINLNGSATKDNTTGTLFSAGDFTGGNKGVGSGDTLNVTYSASL